MMSERPLGRGTITIDGEPYATDTFEFEGTRYTIRELSVDEGDDIFDAALEPADPKNPGGEKRLNNRLNTRMLLHAALVEPATALETIGKWGGRKYTTVLRHFNTLNSIPEKDPTLPAGSAGPTSPSGGESSPEPSGASPSESTDDSNGSLPTP